MEKQIVKMYTTIVYNDGSIENIPMAMENTNISLENIDNEMQYAAATTDKNEEIKEDVDLDIAEHFDQIILDDVSKKIVQDIMVLHISKSIYDAGKQNISLDSAIDIAINKVCETLSISKPSVFDKLSRGLKRKGTESGITMEEFRVMAKKFIKDGACEELQELMLDNVTSKGVAGGIRDREAINKFFSNPFMKFSYSDEKCAIESN